MCAAALETKFKSALLIHSSAAFMQQTLTTSLWLLFHKSQHLPQVAACCSLPDELVLQQPNHLLAQFFLPPRAVLAHSSSC
jgi:hypothetical protein